MQHLKAVYTMEKNAFIGAYGPELVIFVHGRLGDRRHIRSASYWSLACVADEQNPGIVFVCNAG